MCARLLIHRAVRSATPAVLPWLPRARCRVVVDGRGCLRLRGRRRVFRARCGRCRSRRCSRSVVLWAGGRAIRLGVCLEQRKWATTVSSSSIRFTICIWKSGNEPRKGLIQRRASSANAPSATSLRIAVLCTFTPSSTSRRTSCLPAFMRRKLREAFALVGLNRWSLRLRVTCSALEQAAKPLLDTGPLLGEDREPRRVAGLQVGGKPVCAENPFGLGS
jgi:hypothetical protein